VILNFRDAQAARSTTDTPVHRRVTDAELTGLRLQAELNSLTQGTKAWRDLVDALVELQDIREERRRGF
jgi:hypothetical protein